MGAGGRIDLAGLDAVTADLRLVVEPAVVVQLPVGAPPRAELSFLTEAWCSARSMLVGFLLVLPLLLVCLALDLLVPFLAPLSTTIKLFATALGLSWSLLDYPLTLRNLHMRQRLALFKRRAGPVLGFGATLAPLSRPMEVSANDRWSG